MSKTENGLVLRKETGLDTDWASQSCNRRKQLVTVTLQRYPNFETAQSSGGSEAVQTGLSRPELSGRLISKFV